MNELLQFSEKLIEASGGIVEWGADRSRFEALLSQDFQKGLGLSGSLVSISEPGHGERRSGDFETLTMGYGTELLDQLIPMALNMGCAAAVAMPPATSPKKTALDVGSRLAFTNSAFREQATHKSTADYWLWSLEVTADADERRQLQYHTCISQHLVHCPGLSELIPAQAAHWESISLKPSEVSPEGLDRLFVTACHRTLEGLEEGLSEFKATIMRHHLRDMERIETYFLDLTEEMCDQGLARSGGNRDRNRRPGRNRRQPERSGGYGRCRLGVAAGGVFALGRRAIRCIETTAWCNGRAVLRGGQYCKSILNFDGRRSLFGNKLINRRELSVIGDQEYGIPELKLHKTEAPYFAVLYPATRLIVCL